MQPTSAKPLYSSNGSPPLARCGTKVFPRSPAADLHSVRQPPATLLHQEVRMSDSGESWYYEENGTRTGPVARGRMRELIRARDLGPSTLVWGGSGEWIAANESALSEDFVAARGGAPPPLPGTAVDNRLAWRLLFTSASSECAGRPPCRCAPAPRYSLRNCPPPRRALDPCTYPRAS